MNRRSRHSSDFLERHVFAIFGGVGSGDLEEGLLEEVQIVELQCEDELDLGFGIGSFVHDPVSGETCPTDDAVGSSP